MEGEQTRDLCGKFIEWQWEGLRAPSHWREHANEGSHWHRCGGNEGLEDKKLARGGGNVWTQFVDSRGIEATVWPKVLVKLFTHQSPVPRAPHYPASVYQWVHLGQHAQNDIPMHGMAYNLIPCVPVSKPHKVQEAPGQFSQLTQNDLDVLPNMVHSEKN